MRAHFSARRSSCGYITSEVTKGCNGQAARIQQRVNVQGPWREGWCRWVVQKSQKRWWGQHRAVAAKWEDRGGCRSGRCPPRGSFYFSHPKARRCKQTRQGLETQSRQPNDCVGLLAISFTCSNIFLYMFWHSPCFLTVSHLFHTAEIGLGIILKMHSTTPLITTKAMTLSFLLLLKPLERICWQRAEIPAWNMKLLTSWDQPTDSSTS